MTGQAAGRRDLLRLAAGVAALGTSCVAGATGRTGTTVAYPPVRRDTVLRFPRDHGAHPAFRTEWWYLTGWLRRHGPAGSGSGSESGSSGSGSGSGSGDSNAEDGWLGVQITFFRSRTGHSPDNPSRFAPTQLLLAHAALALPERGRLLHAQRAARAGFGLAAAAESDTAVSIGDWRLRRDGADRYHAQLRNSGFALDLQFRAPAPPVLQGEQGFSRKGPGPLQASHYYSRPQARTTGTIVIDGRPISVAGTSWIDHEWSSEILDRDASGWDWVGLNFDDGSALMAFRIRRRDGGVAWSTARWIDASGQPVAPDPTPGFAPLRHWRSPRTGAQYPVAMAIDLGTRRLTLQPLFDDQELDTRGSTGTIYWEGAVAVFEDGRRVGRGYLELTGYATPLRL
ncbi:MAG: lipocalin-like domain-containing protein [Burkholderiaceae bacterium]